MMFPKDFVWGVATSAYQIEGKDASDGAGDCVWDTFVKSGRIFEGNILLEILILGWKKKKGSAKIR